MKKRNKRKEQKNSTFSYIKGDLKLILFFVILLVIMLGLYFAQSFFNPSPG